MIDQSLFSMAIATFAQAGCISYFDMTLRRSSNSLRRKQRSVIPFIGIMDSIRAIIETNILLADGVAWFKAEGTIRMFEGLGRPWSAVRMFRILPRTVSRMIYECIAANRFRIFGKRESCFVVETEMKERFLA